MLIDAFHTAYNPKKGFGEELVEKAFIPFNLIEAADAKLSEKRESPIPNMDTVYRVSGLSKMCPVEEVLRYKNKIIGFNSVDSKLRKTFDFGNAFHSVAQNTWFGKFGWLVGDWICTNCGEKYLDQVMPDHVCDKCGRDDKYHYVELFLEAKEEFVSGHPDGILRLEGVDYLMELKSSNNANFEYIKNFLRRPLDAHLDQIQMYMYLLKKKHGLVVYFNKDTSEWMQFYVYFDQSRVTNQIGKVKDTKDGIKSGVVPFEKRICKVKTCDRAKKCSVRNLCFK